jgi:nucleoside-diphosphate-sugar epimerase
MKRVLVTGGTGTLGRVVVRRLLAAGHEVRVVSRRARPAGEARAYTSMRFDLRQAEGVDSVFAGVDTVIHCASTRRGGDVEAAQNVIAASRRARCTPESPTIDSSRVRQRSGLRH